MYQFHLYIISRILHQRSSLLDLWVIISWRHYSGLVELSSNQLELLRPPSDHALHLPVQSLSLNRLQLGFNLLMGKLLKRLCRLVDLKYKAQTMRCPLGTVSDWGYCGGWADLGKVNGWTDWLFLLETHSVIPPHTGL